MVGGRRRGSSEQRKLMSRVVGRKFIFADRKAFEGLFETGRE
jgi:hypothetical protein